MTRSNRIRPAAGLAALALAALSAPALTQPALAQVLQLDRPINLPDLQPRLPAPDRPLRLPPEIIGNLGACPDLAVRLGQSDRADGSIMLTFTVVNVGTADYVSGANQQNLLVNFGGRTRLVYDFQNLRRGENRSWHYTYHPFEFPSQVRAMIVFDPDIRNDGNPMNDDCNPRNDRATMTTAR